MTGLRNEQRVAFVTGGSGFVGGQLISKLVFSAAPAEYNH